MAKPIQISLVANTRGFIAGTKDAGRALDDVSDSLDDVARDAKRAGEQAGDGLAGNVKDGVRDGERSLERLESEFRQLATAAKRETGAAGDAVGDSFSRGTHRAGEAAGSFKEEAVQNFSEVASSFDGSMQGAADGVQGLFGGLASSLPLPLGIAAGTIGLIFGTMLQGLSNDSEAVKQQVSELAAEFIDTGKAGKLSVGYIADALKTLATNTDGNSESLGDLLKTYRKAGTEGVSTFKDVANAVVGAGGNYDDLIKKNQDYLGTLQQQAAQVDRSVGSDKAAANAIDEKVKAQQHVVDKLKDSQTAASEAADAQKAYAESGAADLQAKADALDDINSNLKDGADNWDDYKTAAGGLDVSKYIEGYEKLAEAIVGAATGIANSNLPDEAKAYLQSLPPEQQAAYISAYQKAAPATQQKLGAIWQATGKANGDTYVKNLNASIPSTVKGPVVAATLAKLPLDQLLREAQNYVDKRPIKLTTSIKNGAFGRGEF